MVNKKYEYDIGQFHWSQQDNSFYGDAAFLYLDNQDHPEPFPNQKKSFYIKNNGSGNFRMFTFVKEDSWEDQLTGDIYEVFQFISEDGINCNVIVGLK
jgi:hypothetical protein